MRYFEHDMNNKDWANLKVTFAGGFRFPKTLTSELFSRLLHTYKKKKMNLLWKWHNITYTPSIVNSLAKLFNLMKKINIPLDYSSNLDSEVTF